MANKPKTPQPETPTKNQIRDNFETPRYATELLIPFIPSHVKSIWEPMCGSGKMARVFSDAGYEVNATDLKTGNNIFHIVECGYDCFITNPAFSIKKKVWMHLVGFDLPLALLVPADYSTWVIEAIEMGAEKLIPTRRIDYITPNVLIGVKHGELFKKHIRKDYPEYKTIKQVGKSEDPIWKEFYDKYNWWDIHSYDSVDQVSNDLLAKYSASQFHSMWLTWKFNIGKSETFVPLTNKMKRKIL